MALSILIVDDSPVMRAFISRVIAVSGLDAAERLEAANGQQALDLLRDRRVDIILTDVNMPTMNGEEFLERLEQNARLRGVPVLVVSTDGSESRVRRMIELGARGYLKKPFSPDLLRERIEQTLGLPREGTAPR